jgi:RecG-like helicase
LDLLLLQVKTMFPRMVEVGVDIQQISILILMQEERGDVGILGRVERGLGGWQ